MTLPIADQVATMQAGMAGQLPPAVADIFGAEQRALTAAGVPDGVPRPGDAMPDGDLIDSTGHPTTLRGTQAGRPAVVVLYRGAWCPYCNLTLRAYQQQLVAPLAERGVALIAISPQKADGSLSMQEKNELTFSVLSDPGNQIASALGVLTGPSDEVRGVQAQLGLDVAATNADGTDRMPMPTVALVDQVGVIRWIDVHPDYTTRSEPADILAALALL